MSPRPFPFRLVVSVGVATLLIVAVCGAVIHAAGRRAVYLQQVSDLDHLAQLVRQWVPAGGGGGLGPGDRARIDDLARTLGTRITLIDGAGNILLDSDATTNLMDNHNDRPEVVAARAGGVGHVARRSGTLGENSVYVARLLDPARPDGPVVRVSHWRENAPLLGTSLLAVAGAAAVSGLGAALTLWRLLRNQWVAPLRAVADAAEHVAHGDWRRRAQPAGADDVRALAAQVNELADVAERQHADLAHERADLKALADTIPDAVVVSDAADRVALINPAAAALLDVRPEKAVGQKMINVLGDEDVVELLESVRRGPPPATGAAAGGAAGGASGGASGAGGVDARPAREIRLVRDGQHLTFQALAQLTSAGGVLMVLRDVSTLSGTVQMKADFVANASHELRTPIAAIKIAFETLREVYAEDPRQAERCLSIIEGHMNRLEEMLRDLLDLSRVESAEMRPHLRDLSSDDLFASLRATMGSLARTKGVDLHLDDDEPVHFTGDERLLNLVLKNLVENSIKFTPAGGSVTVTVREPAAAAATDVGAGAGGEGVAGGSVVLAVSDTGIGIPPEHTDRVFERFYQVDAARSGSAGRGTGLGLAIVKHAVHAMGGTVQIRSTLGRGTVVTCTIPQSVRAGDAVHVTQG